MPPEAAKTAKWIKKSPNWAMVVIFDLLKTICLVPSKGMPEEIRLLYKPDGSPIVPLR